MTVHQLLRRLLRYALTGHGRSTCYVKVADPALYGDLDQRDHLLTWVHAARSDHMVVLLGQAQIPNAPDPTRG